MAEMDDRDTSLADAAPVDWAKVPSVVATQDASPMRPTVTSLGQEQKVIAEDTKIAKDMGWFETIGESFTNGGNAIVQMVYDINRIEKSGPADPTWKDGNVNKWIANQGGAIPVEQAWRYTQTNNQLEATTLLKDAQDQARSMHLLNLRSAQSAGAAFGTFTAQALAGLADIDAPLMFATGLIGAGLKTGINATKIGRLMTGGASGAMQGAGWGAGAYFSDPNSDWTSIPVAGLMGLGLGTVGGAFARAPSRHMAENVSEAANRKLDDVITEYDEALQDGMPLSKTDLRKESFPDTDRYGSTTLKTVIAEQEVIQEAAEKAATEGAARKPTKIDLADVDGVRPEDVSTEGRSTVGARQMGQTGPGVAAITKQRILDIVQNAKADPEVRAAASDWFGNNNKLRQMSDPVARGARRFMDYVDATGIGSDFGKMMNTGSAVAQKVAYDLFENASGIVRNNRTAAALQEHYQKHILGDFLPYHNAFEEWTGKQGKGAWQRTWDSSLREGFDREVIQELQARKYTGTLSTDPAIKKAADAIDKMFAKEIDVGKGRPGEASWKGFDTLKKEAGYFPQKWLGGKMQRLINSSNGAITKNTIIDALTEAYRSQHAAMKPKDAKIWASALVNRAMRQDDGLTTNLVSVLQSDGRGMLENTLRANGISEKEIERLIDGLTGNMEKTGAPGQTKQRIDVDMRFTASNGINMLDLIDTDINKIAAQRARRTAGQGALARKGITSKQDWDDVVEAIIEEQKANGPNVKTGNTLKERFDDAVDSDNVITKEYMDDLYTYFSGAPLGGGLSPMYSRMKKLTNLALLNQLGLTQMAELGATMSAVGFKRFMEHAGEAFNARIGNPDSELVKELSHMNIFIPEERMFRDDLTFEYEKANPNASEFMQRFDNILNKGQRAQGYISGFYEVRKMQQRIAMSAGTDKLMTGLKNGTDGFSADRLRDIGVDANMANELKALINNGTIEFKDGKLFKLNMNQWAPELAENYSLVMGRSTNQLVQKAMAGESSILFHKDGVSSLFFHLKSFPLLAMEKQGARNLMMADQQALTTFIYGLVTAGLAYSIKQGINGREQNLTASKIATGAIGLSNMTGWIPMWTDPIAGLLGIDSLQSGGGKYGSNSVISTPASLTTLDKMTQIPSAMISLANPWDTFSNGDIRALQATPIVGNLYGFSFMLNAMKSDNVSRKKAKEPAQEEPEFDPVAAALAASE